MVKLGQVILKPAKATQLGATQRSLGQDAGITKNQFTKDIGVDLLPGIDETKTTIDGLVRQSPDLPNLEVYHRDTSVGNYVEATMSPELFNRS